MDITREKVAVIGADGQLGRDISETLSGHDPIKLTHSDIDIVDFEQTRKVIKESGVSVVVNTAAMHNVDACEQNPAQSFAVNGIGARNLALTTRELGITLVHISTDYVFDGIKNESYQEGDIPNPLNVYGNTKLAGEYFIRNIAEKFYILRVSALYGKNPCRAKGGLNFVTLMLKLAKERDEIRVVDNEFVTPTCTEDIARQISHMLRNDGDYGLYHCTAQGECSWYAFAAKIFELTGTKIQLSIADPKEFPIKVPRPLYSVLENTALKSYELDIMPHWEDGLANFLNSL